MPKKATRYNSPFARPPRMAPHAVKAQEHPADGWRWATADGSLVDDVGQAAVYATAAELEEALAELRRKYPRHDVVPVQASNPKE